MNPRPSDPPIQPLPTTGQQIVFEPSGPFVTDLREYPGRSNIDPAAPAYPIYHLLSELRSPIALRELMIDPVRRGYIGQPGVAPPVDLPRSAAELYPDVKVQVVGVRCADGIIRCQVYSPPGDGKSRPVILYLHGGGFSVGSSEDTATITSRMASETGSVVVSVNYRMAPEWPFPCAVEDSLAVYQALLTDASLLGGDASRIAVAGDSAGGNLAAVIPLAAMDRGLSLPTATVLLCPITNFCAEDHESFERLAATGIVYDTAFFGFIRGAYLLRKENWTHRYASPALAEITSYPPTLVVGGGEDPIIDDNRAFVTKLQSSGFNARLIERDGMPHGYYFFAGLMPQGEEVLAEVSQFISKHLAVWAK